MAYTDPLKILLVASEVDPLSKTGGLADVAGALPCALAELGHEVRVVTPRYRGVERARFALEPVAGLPVPTGYGDFWCGVERALLPHGRVPVFLINRRDLFDRGGLYGDEHGAFGDNCLRYAVLCRAALRLCRHWGWTPDVVSCHDWHAALIPCLLDGPEAPDLSAVATVLTIHNGAFQGVFAPGEVLATGLGPEWWQSGALEWSGALNLLKAGALHATRLNAVSERYAWELQTREGGFGLDPIWRERAADLYGITNGIDYREWHPSVDRHIPARFDVDRPEGKARCKAVLQNRFGLPVSAETPLIGWVGRLTAQKGIDLFAEALPWLLGLDLHIVLLGSGEPWAERYYQEMAWRHPRRFAVHVGYDTPLAHQIEAGADFFLMPSRYEPCGLNQLYSQAYGTLPIVRATGGLADTVENLDERSLAGTGFTFENATAQALFDAVGWALWNWYHRPDLIQRMRRQAMLRNFSWTDAAEGYEILFREAVLHRRGWI